MQTNLYEMERESRHVRLVNSGSRGQMRRLLTNGNTKVWRYISDAETGETLSSTHNGGACPIAGMSRPLAGRVGKVRGKELGFT